VVLGEGGHVHSETMIGIANRNDLIQFREFALRRLLELCI